MELKALMPQKMKQAKRDRSSIPSLQNLDVVETVGSQSTMSNPTRNIIISDKAYMDYMSGENSLLPKTVKNYVIYNEKRYYTHPIYTSYAASKSGKVINCQTMRKLIGRKNYNGYMQIFLKMNNKKQKTNFVHRFVYECFHGIIPDGKVIDHINDIRDDNRIKNLQIMTQQENCLKSAKNRDYGFAANNHKNVKCVKATNCETNEINYYHSTYKAGKELGINPGLIKMVAEGLNKCKTGISKFNQQAYCFEYIDENELPTKSVSVKWRKQTFTCPNCKKQMQNGSKYNHMKSCGEPIESFELDIKMKESDDEFTENEKQLIDKKFNAMMKKINNGNFPYKKHLHEHLPNIEFW